MDRAREVTLTEDSPFSRFYSSGKQIAALIGPYMKETGAPEDEINKLIGHYGIMGETNNTINFVLAGLQNDLKFSNEPSEGALRRTFLLSTMEHHESQYSHLTHSGETVIAACNRIIDDIGEWTDRHADIIRAEDRLQILSHRDEFARSLNEIHAFIRESRTFFETFDVPVNLPKRYQSVLRPQNGNQSLALPPANQP